MTTLYLIRHGETDWNRTGQAQGQTDVPLNDLGRRQALALGARVAGLHITQVYSSDLRRARDTAALALPGHAPRLDRRLRELDVGRRAGLTHEQYSQLDPEWTAAFERDGLHTPFPGGESFADLQSRALAALLEIAARHPGERVAIVSHGGPIRFMLCHALALPYALRNRFRLDNTGISGLLWQGEEGKVLFLNETAHLSVLGEPRPLEL